ncbi:MAG: phage protein Gp37 [Pseudomonadota bacterium]
MTPPYGIDDIEDTIITALAPLKLPASLGVRTIKTYQDDLEFTDKEKIKKLLTLLPAIFVIYGGSGYTPHGDRKTEAMVYSIFVCDKTVKDEAEARRGGKTNPGTYAMLRAVRALLYGQQLSLEITPLELQRESPVFIGGGISVYAADYSTAQALIYPSA